MVFTSLLVAVLAVGFGAVVFVDYASATGLLTLHLNSAISLLWGYL